MTSLRAITETPGAEKKTAAWARQGSPDKIPITQARAVTLAVVTTAAEETGGGDAGGGGDF